MDTENPESFYRKGWAKFAGTPQVADWVSHAKSFADAAVADPANAQWLRCQGTWFVGVNALPNKTDGRLAGKALPAPILDALERLSLPTIHWDRAQVSVMYPGYPKPRAGESEAAFRFRRDRDAAHVDGLLPMPPDNRRFLKEPHAFVLGIPLTICSPDASPLVVWEGSHEQMRARLGAALQEAPDWTDVDLTDVYTQSRRDCFDRCNRLTLPATPGEFYIIHRLALHGVAPWSDTATAPPEGRMIAYFRPEFSGPISQWIETP